MTRELWFGPVLNNNRDRLVKMCSERIRSGRPQSFLYLAAAQPLLDSIFGELLDGDQNSATWGPVQVYLFRFFIRRLISGAVFAETGESPKPRKRIDRDENPLKTGIVSLILRRLADEGRLKSFGSLARSEGCARTVERLLGEIQRAAFSATDFDRIVKLRAGDAGDSAVDPIQSETDPVATPLQTEFDKDLSLIYSHYTDCLERSLLTEDDADQLIALDYLRGKSMGQTVEIPWLSGVELLVIDGFYDFTPIQGVILRLLIPQIPNVIVNLNHDAENPEIFRPFGETVALLESITKFDTPAPAPPNQVAEGLEFLRTRLFNPANVNTTPESLTDDNEQVDEASRQNAKNIKFFDCGDPEVELRTIAKEIKRLVVNEGYQLSEIALVLRQPQDYAEVLFRVWEDEGVPCKLKLPKPALEIPAIKAATRFLELCQEICAQSLDNLKIASLASVIKTGYFGSEIGKATEKGMTDESDFNSRIRLASRQLDVDEFENVIAYVGEDQTIMEWLARCSKLIETRVNVQVPVSQSRTESMDDERDLPEDDDDAFEVKPGELARTSPVREIDRATLLAASGHVSEWNELFRRLPQEGSVRLLADALVSNLSRAGFKPLSSKPWPLLGPEELSAMLIDERAFETLNLSFEAAVRSFSLTDKAWNGNSEVSLSDFIRMSLVCLRDLQISAGIEKRNGVSILPATDIRGLKFRVLFIAGLVEGGFPMRTRRDWIYPHEERERLKDYGLVLEDTSPNTLLKEEHYFYQTACRATDRLYLSRPFVNADGSEMVESYYIGELKHALSPQGLETVTIPSGLGSDKLFDSSTPLELILKTAKKHHDGAPELRPDGFEARLQQWIFDKGFQSLSAVRRIGVERERRSLGFGPYDGRITNVDLLESLKHHFGVNHIFSASQLGLYGKCPFKFYAERVLKLEPRGEAAADLAAMDSGSMLHEILRRFFTNHRAKQLESSKIEPLRQEMRHIADQVFDEFEAITPPLKASVWRLERDIRKIILDQFLADEIRMQDQLSFAGMKPAFFELAFGAMGDDIDPASTAEYLKLHRNNDDDEIRIQGRIDRVDRATDGIIVAYDYKLTSGARERDMRDGRDLQLGIYLAALEDLFRLGNEIAGGGYYILKPGSGRRNMGLYRNAFSTYTGIGKTLSNLNDDDWFELRNAMIERVWAFRTEMREGRFDVAPSAPTQTCAHCDFAAMCRYEPHRIQLKMQNRQEEEIAF